MTDIVERLRAPIDPDAVRVGTLTKERREAADEIMRLRAEIEQQRKQWEDVWRRNVDLLAEIERLTTENWQLKGALGYPVPGHIMEGDFKCGLCEAKTDEIERLGEIVRQRTFLLDQQLGTPCEQIRHEQEVERLKVALVQQAGIMHRFGGRNGEGEGDH